ncbi:MAG: ABC transporter, partial [Lachnospiraceae bacterium]|nr:ABC transporter [Lachnospiraceae bacterium]
VDALIAEGVDAIFTPTDNTIMNAELAIFEKLQEAGIPHYAGADSFALNGAFLGFGVNYVDLGIETANMVADLLENEKTPDQIPVVTFDSGIATINTETAEAIGMDLDAVKDAFGPFCSEIIETQTAQDF